MHFSVYSLFNPRTFLSPQKETLCPLSYPLLLPSSFLTTINLLSISMDLPGLGISHKWNHTPRAFLCLAFFLAWCLQGSSVFLHVSAVHSFLQLNNIPLWIENILCIHPSVDGHSGCFWFLAILNNAATVCVHIFVWTVFLFSWLYTQEWNCGVTWWVWA